MKKIVLLFSITLLISCSGNAQNSEKKVFKKYEISKTVSQWKNQLTPIQFFVLREAGTERPFTSSLNNNKENGLYVCAACENPLYKSDYKYDSGTGWPSFDRAIKNQVELDVDYKIGVPRTELRCASCGGHLGHSFSDGPRDTTGERHCINGAALKFKKINN